MNITIAFLVGVAVGAVLFYGGSVLLRRHARPRKVVDDVTEYIHHDSNVVLVDWSARRRATREMV